MITNKWKKTLRQLQQKKYRKQWGLFVVEGRKVIEECMRYAPGRVERVFATENLCNSWQETYPEVYIEPAREEDIRACSALQNNKEAIAIMRMDTASNEFPSPWSQRLVVYLDHVQDPGNLGTIMRICDWYGLPVLLASEDTVDVWNTKTIQASKGSFLRVSVHYIPIESILSTLKPRATVWGADLDGENIHLIGAKKEQDENTLILVMGNEANGIRENTRALIDKYVTIPRYGKAESLNVAMATAILLDNLKREGY